jgi:hypothetical protein
MDTWDEREKRAIQTLKDAGYWPTEAGIEAMEKEKGYEATRDKLTEALDRLSGEELLAAYGLIADLAGAPEVDAVPEPAVPEDEQTGEE